MITFVILIIEGIQLPLVMNMVIPIKENFKLITLETQILSASVFVGISIGSILLGIASEYLHRKVVVINCIVIILLFQLLTILINDFYLFLLARLFNGFAVGLIVPIGFNITCEVLPIHNRSFSLIVIFTGFGFGSALTLLFIYILMPNYQVAKLSHVYLCLWLVTFVIFIYVAIAFKDSPRNLILNNNIDEAITILEEIQKKKIHEEERERLVNEVAFGGSTNMLSSEIVFYLKRITLLRPFCFVSYGFY